MNMTRFPGYYLLALSFAGAIFPLPAGAQNAEPEETHAAPANAVERIETESLGNVTIEIPDNILENIIKEERRNVQTGPVLRPGINKVAGYRVQVFRDGHNQSTLESRANARGSAIVARFPKYRGQVYSHSSAPNWYTRIGNFRTAEEAAAALAELKRAFPQYASEMRVVKTQIVVIK